MTMSNMHTLNI